MVTLGFCFPEASAVCRGPPKPEPAAQAQICLGSWTSTPPHPGVCPSQLGQEPWAGVEEKDRAPWTAADSEDQLEAAKTEQRLGQWRQEEKDNGARHVWGSLIRQFQVWGQRMGCLAYSRNASKFFWVSEWTHYTGSEVTCPYWFVCQYIIMKNFKPTEKLKELYSDRLYTLHGSSMFNSLLDLLHYISSHQSTRPSIWFLDASPGHRHKCTSPQPLSMHISN